MADPLPFIRLSTLKDTLVIGPGVESDRFRFDDPPLLASSTQTLALDPSGYFGVVAVPAIPGDVVGPASSTNDDIATYNGATGKIIKDASGITALAGALGGVTTINGLPVPVAQWGDVRGPGSSTANTLATYGDGTGKNIVDATTIQASGAGLTGVGTINGLPVPVSQWGDVRGPASAVTNTVATYNGATGKLIQDTSVTIVGGAVSGVTTINGSSIPSPIGDVVGPAGATDTALAIYNGATGKVIQNSTATLSAAGVLSLAAPGTSGIIFNNPTSPTGDGSLLDFYEQSTNSTVAWIATTTTISSGNVLVATRIGNMATVVVTFPNMTQSSGADSNDIHALAAIPAFARPLTTRTDLVGTFDSAAGQNTKIGYWVINASGDIYVYSEATNGSAAVTPWSNGATVGLASQNHTGVVLCQAFTLSYCLDP